MITNLKLLDAELCQEALVPGLPLSRALVTFLQPSLGIVDRSCYCPPHNVPYQDWGAVGNLAKHGTEAQLVTTDRFLLSDAPLSGCN